MIKQFSAKNLVGFSEIELEFSNGLNVFSGPSGAGKSVLIDGLLSTLGFSEAKASVAESEIDATIYRVVKKEKTRWFMDEEPISKKALSQTLGSKLLYLSANEQNTFSRRALLALLDDDTKQDYDKAFEAWQNTENKLSSLLRNASEIEQKRDFLKYEIEKIDLINPKEGEQDELLEKKRAYSQIEKLKTALAKTEGIYGFKSSVVSLFEILNIETSVCDNFFAEVEDATSSAKALLDEPEDIDKIMTRLDELNSLTKKYGGIEEAIEARRQKTEELKKLECIDELISDARLECETCKQIANDLAHKLSKKRREAAKVVQNNANKYLEALKLPSCEIKLGVAAIDALGIDSCEIVLGKTKTDNISAGESRRLRLALLASSTYSEQNIIILDEADANLSGAESAAVAKLLADLAMKYQIFAITHQAQTAAVATTHFLVTKASDVSYVTRLSKEEKICEVARMLSGDEINEESKRLAQTMIGN